MSAEIIFFSNGNAAVLRDGAQQPELQRPWAELFADFLESRGADPTTFRLQMPYGQHARFFRTSEGRWNWNIAEDVIACNREQGTRAETLIETLKQVRTRLLEAAIEARYGEVARLASEAALLAREIDLGGGGGRPPLLWQ